MKNGELSNNDEDYLKSKIYIIRGVQVMIDADLAEIYGYSTKRFNEQVKNNIERFDEDMRFQLTSNEYDVLRCKNCTSKILPTDYKSTIYNDTEVLRSKISTSKPETRGGRQYLPYAFTEQGIYMLMTVLKGELAVDQSKNLKTLVLLKSVSPNIKVTIFSDNVNHGLHQTEFNDFKKEYPNVDISLKTTGGIYHDRYIFIDHGTKNEMIFHCGGSSKDAGKRVTSITKVEDNMLYQGILQRLQNNPKLW